MVYKVYTFLHTKFLNYHNSAPWWLLRIYTHAHAQSAPSGHCHYIVYIVNCISQLCSKQPMVRNSTIYPIILCCPAHESRLHMRDAHG